MVALPNDSKTRPVREDRPRGIVIDRWGKTVLTALLQEETVWPRSRKPPNPDIYPEEPSESGQIIRPTAPEAHRSWRSQLVRVHSEGIFLGGYRKFCPHRGPNSGRQAEALSHAAWPAEPKLVSHDS